MIKKHFITRIIAFTLCVALMLIVVPFTGEKEIYAASVKTISGSKESVVCGTTAKIKLPSGYSKCKFVSSNKKVATVTAKGVVKARRLGVVKITATAGAKKNTYTITVRPKNKKDVWLNYESVLVGQKFQLCLESDKYDTSQVNLRFSSGYDEISKKGKCNGIEYAGWGSMDYSYGSFKKYTRLMVFSPEEIVDNLLGKSWYDTTNGVDAGVLYEAGVENPVDDEKAITPSELRDQGISLSLDGEIMPDNVLYTPGEHTISVVCGSETYNRPFSASYPIKEVLIRRDATGYDPEYKEVFDAAFSATEQVITEGMSDEEKVKALHDYLIYHANYYKDGDLSNPDAWAYGACGVLLHGEGVCQSYAIAFYMMATAVGLDCKYVTGVATNSSGHTGGHAWNQVKVNDIWYSIDCTWDDPIGGGGGHERYDYYLSENCWTNHTVEEMQDLANEERYYWENYYLTGKKY